MKRFMVLSLLVICYLTIGTESASCNGPVTSDQRKTLMMYINRFPSMGTDFVEVGAISSDTRDKSYGGAFDALFEAIALQSKILLSMATAISKLNADVANLNDEISMTRTVAASSGRLPRSRRRRRRA